MNTDDTPSTVDPLDPPNPDDTGPTNPVDEDDPSIAALALDALKQNARTLGVSFHPSIGEAKLREKISEHVAATATPAPAETAPAALPRTDAGEGLGPMPTRALNANTVAAKALVRVRVTAMNPAHSTYDGEIFSVSNAAVGTIKRYVPFGVAWHIEAILLNVLEAKKYQVFREIKIPGGGKRKEGALVKAFAIERLPALTAEEIRALAQRQIATGSMGPVDAATGQLA